MHDEHNFDLLNSSYRKQHRIREQFRNDIEQHIHRLLRANNIEPHQIESRTKTFESIVDKCKRKEITANDDLSNIHDLTGIRIITNHRSEYHAVSDIIDKHLDIIPGLSEDKSNQLDYNVFDYLSIHKTARIPKSLCSELEWGYCEDFSFEVQIRTILQHAWALTSHEILYKREDIIPKKIKRRISLLA